MSRIGKKAISIPAGVTVELAGAIVKVSSGQNTLTQDIDPKIKVTVDTDAKEVHVAREGDDRHARAMHGTVRALIANMIVGVTKGYEKSIQIYGTGFGVKQQGAELHITVGFAKPCVVKIPQGITLDIDSPNARGNDSPATFKIKGSDKCMVGQFAADCRRVKPPEPYQGKGVRYADEVIKRKVGKAFASGG